MTYSAKREYQEIEDFIEFFGIENIPNPDQYPKQLEFLIKSFRHYKNMEKLKNEN